MKTINKVVTIIIALICAFTFLGCDTEYNSTGVTGGNFGKEYTLQIGNINYTLILYQNPTTKVFTEEFPKKITMGELNGNEKYYYTNYDLPTKAENIKTIHIGDVMLYGADCIVIFYKEFTTTYNYTKLGYIKDTTGLVAALGTGSAQVIFSDK